MTTTPISSCIRRKAFRTSTCRAIRSTWCSCKAGRRAIGPWAISGGRSPTKRAPGSITSRSASPARSPPRAKRAARSKSPSRSSVRRQAASRSRCPCRSSNLAGLPFPNPHAQRRALALLAVGRKQPETLAVAHAQRPEMPLVQGEDVSRSVPLGKDDERRVGQADSQVRVAFYNFARGLDVGCIEPFELVGPSDHFIEQRGLRAGTDVPREKIVQFRQDERREQQWRRRLGERSRAIGVAALAGIDG